MKQKWKLWHWIAIVTVSVLVLLMTGIGIWWGIKDVESFSEGWSLISDLAAPRENDVYYKKSYSASDKKAKKWADRVVANAGGEQLTNGELQVYYWMNVYTFLNYNSYYAVSAGLDYTQPFDKQTSTEFDGTWQQYFLDMALENWHKEQALALIAQESGITLGVEQQVELDNLRKELAVSAVDGGYSSIDAMLHHDMGAGCSYEDYYSYRYTYYLADAYFTLKNQEALDKITADDWERYFQEHQEELDKKGITKESGQVYDVRHILLIPKDGKEDEQGNVTYTDEAWEACREEAQKLLDKWLDEGGDEALFAKYADQYSEDTGSNTNGGLYEGLAENTDILKEFVEWYSGIGRKVGDYGLVKTQRGYHIMYLSAMEPQWEAAAKEGLLKDASDQLVAEALKRYPMTVDYKNVVLSVVDLTTLE